MTDGDALLAAIFARPADDTVRLAYADWLDEQAPGRVACGRCRGAGIVSWDGKGLARTAMECPICLGRGTIPDSHAARATFIRVQVELATLPPEPRKLFVADGAGALMEGLGVGLIHEGDGHYSASSAERGLSTETFLPGERVDIYAEVPGKKGPRWMRGLKYVKHVEGRRQVIVFRKGEQSGPWKGLQLKSRSDELLAAHRRDWLGGPKCGACGGKRTRTARWRIAEMNADDYGESTSTCDDCHGTGYECWPLLEMTHGRFVNVGPFLYLITSHFTRGFVSRIELPAEQYTDKVARLIFTHHPTVTEVVFMDAVELPYDPVAWGRELAGLPPLTTR